MWSACAALSGITGAFGLGWWAHMGVRDAVRDAIQNEQEGREQPAWVGLSAAKAPVVILAGGSRARMPSAAFEVDSRELSAQEVAASAAKVWRDGQGRWVRPVASLATGICARERALSEGLKAAEGAGWSERVILCRLSPDTRIGPSKELNDLAKECTLVVDAREGGREMAMRVCETTGGVAVWPGADGEGSGAGKGRLRDAVCGNIPGIEPWEAWEVAKVLAQGVAAVPIAASNQQEAMQAAMRGSGGGGKGSTLRVGEVGRLEALLDAGVVVPERDIASSRPERGATPLDEAILLDAKAMEEVERILQEERLLARGLDLSSEIVRRREEKEHLLQPLSELEADAEELEEEVRDVVGAWPILSREKRVSAALEAQRKFRALKGRHETLRRRFNDIDQADRDARREVEMHHRIGR